MISMIPSESPERDSDEFFRPDMIFRFRILFIVCVLLVLQSCTPTTSIDIKDCRKAEANQYATGFSIQFCPSDTVLFLFNPNNITDTIFSLRINTQNSMSRLACLSTTHLPFLETLNTPEKAVGVGFAEYLFDEKSKARIDSGDLVNLTAAGKLDFETVVSLAPEALLVYYYGNEDFTRYEQSGIKVIPINEYAEAHPLGRVEWIKVFGLLTGNYSNAITEFNKIDSSYKALVNSIPEMTKKPVVFTGSFYKGKWAAPGGDSFIAKFISDAGALYAFADYPGNDNINLDFETVLTMIAGADYFGKVIYRESGVLRNDFLEEQNRFELLKAFDDSHLFYCNTATTDYFGRGIMEPHLMLQDLIGIFHPEIASPYKAVYFHPLKPGLE
jgi:iron complex transport system substrate-binding protein